jgi:hypothetical protein
VRPLFSLLILFLETFGTSNRYGSLYLPPYALSKARQAQQDLKQKKLSPPSDSVSDVSDLPLVAQAEKKKKKHASKVLSRVISGVSKSSKNELATEVTLTAPAAVVGAPPSNSPPTLPAAATPSNTHSNLIGTNWMDAEFTDQSDLEKSMSRDLRMNHKFLVRGKNYARDGKKIETGPAIFRLVIMEIYEVESGTRHDHIASMGRAKQRIDALNRFARPPACPSHDEPTSLAEPPYLYVMNFQIPGDPPVSILSIFAGPPSLAEVVENDTEDTACYKRMWQSYYTSTFESEADRLESWGLDDSNGSDGLNPPALPENGPKGSWKLPSDITWGSPKEPGVYPITDFKNMR